VVSGRVQARGWGRDPGQELFFVEKSGAGPNCYFIFYTLFADLVQCPPPFFTLYDKPARTAASRHLTVRLLSQ
jgi:hypothetical protein